MIYREVIPIEKNEAEQAFASQDPGKICDALVRLTFFNPDWRKIQGMCLDFLRHENLDVRSLAVVCLGHLARIHKELDLEKVLPVLEELKKNPEMSGIVEDTLSDINIFIEK